MEARRLALLHRYSDADLHKLRVSLRRMRSLLKLQPDAESRELRRELGRLAQATNAARDWDTCYARLRTSPAYSRFAQIEPLLARGRRTAHSHVRQMLRSTTWSDGLRRWQHYLAATELMDKRHAADADDPGAAARILAAAARRALSREDERSWHKLRIAVKDFRYQLEHASGESPPTDTLATLRQCMALQDELGRWHDTVAHRELLRALAEGLAAGESSASREAIAGMCQQLEAEGEEILTRIRHSLQKGQGTGRFVLWPLQ